MGFDGLKTATVQLGGQEVTVAQLRFKYLRRCLPTFVTLGERVGQAPRDEDLQAILGIVSMSSEVPVEQLDELPISVEELQAAVQVIAQLSGLVPKAGDPNASAATMASDGTTSTPSSPLQPAGPGTSSTT